MRIVDEAVLDTFRRLTRCQWCGRPTEGCDPHHYFFKKGMGSGGRLDHPYNLVGLCRGWWKGKWVSCHQDAEDGLITRYDLLALVSAREGKQQAEVEAELYRLRREPKREPRERGRKGRRVRRARRGPPAPLG